MRSGRPDRPSSTYRFQLRPGFGFAEAAGLADYLRRLGVGAVYASPTLTPTPGSQHGYDVVDPTAANPELGGEPGRKELVRAARAAGLGLVVDIVPNHMSVEVPSANPWWWDVLARGRASPYAHYFDINWDAGPLLVPVLGAASDVDRLAVEDGQLGYYEHRFPIAEGTGGGTPQEVHERQHYRLVDWRRGAAELNYRRFFDVSNLAAVRVELPDVFAATHGEVLRWAREGDVDGLRVDHPDGLADPGGYLRRLREEFGGWLVVEKILEPGERLPASWPVDGTTGYDALAGICAVFRDPAGQQPLTGLAAGLGVPTDYPAVLREARHWVTSRMLLAEVRRIAELGGVPEDAAAELLCSFGVYRSYLPEGRADWEAAVATACERRPDLATHLRALDALVLADPGSELATRIQQTSGMVVAKGTEDTAFYRYNRFVAANEVGGDPQRIALSPGELHAAAERRQASHPDTMTTLSTHDTKRSEDVRARLAVLTELPAEFAAAVRRWTARAPIPEPALNLLAWQSLVGAWPIGADRLRGYLHKAANEAKLATSWSDRDEEFERAVAAWPDAVLGDDELAADVRAFAGRIEPHGWSNSLGQKLLQLCGPGVPDVYQGTELWEYSLVDPDNRRDVDFAHRARVLADLESGLLPEVDASGAAKMHVVRTALSLRRQRPELFDGYRPVAAQGRAAAHAVAFARGTGAVAGLLAVATRLPVGLAAAGGWDGTVLPLPPGDWTDLLSGERYRGRAVALSALLHRYPVALLTRDLS